PAIQQVVVQLLHQLAFRADTIQRLDQQSAEQLLRRHRWSAILCVEPGKASVQLHQNVADEFPYLAQRMTRRHARLRRYIGKQPTLIPKHTAHPLVTCLLPSDSESCLTDCRKGVFQQTVSGEEARCSAVRSRRSATGYKRCHSVWLFVSGLC